MLNNDLVRIRLVSFAYGLASLVGLAILGVLVSPDFAALVKAHFGNGFFATLILLLVPEVAKHIRNLIETKKLGSTKRPFLI
mgnify:CR=1 FL=1